jgi:hypothetical protein
MKNKPFDLKSYFGVGVCLVTILSLGWSLLNQKEIFSIYGSGFYLIALIVEDITSFVYMKKHKEDLVKEFMEQAFKKNDLEKDRKTEVQSSNESFIKILKELLQGFIIIFGLVVFIMNSEIFMTAGAMLWVGTIFNYMLSGFIMSLTLNIPMKIGYDLGWHFDYRKR